MENINTKNLIILGAIILFFALTNSVSAYCTNYAFSGQTSGDCIDEQAYPQNYYKQSGWYYPNDDTYNNNQNPTSQTVEPRTSIVNNYYYNTTTPKVATTNKTITENTSVNKNTTTDNTDTDNYNNSLGASAYNGYSQSSSDNKGNEITALSLRGSGSFMPSSIWQWIIVVILILAIIVLARMFVHKPSPSDHDTHASHAH